jgi:hypothetical protein
LHTATIADVASAQSPRAAAHFHIPPEYVTASLIQDNTYHNMLDILMDEFDWPMARTPL